MFWRSILEYLTINLFLYVIQMIGKAINYCINGFCNVFDVFFLGNIGDYRWQGLINLF